MTPPLWSVLAIVAVTGGGATLLFTHDPAQDLTAQARPDNPGFDPLNLDAADCEPPLNATLEAACEAAGLLPDHLPL